MKRTMGVIKSKYFSNEVHTFLLFEFINADKGNHSLDIKPGLIILYLVSSSYVSALIQ